MQRSRGNPTYEEVCSDTTGFAETVCILYNPDIVALRILVRQFFKIIDPVSINVREMTSEASTGPVSTISAMRISAPSSLSCLKSRRTAASPWLWS